MLLAELVIAEKLPFFILESPFLQRFVGALRPAFVSKMIGRKDMSRAVDEVHADCCQRVSTLLDAKLGKKTCAVDGFKDPTRRKVLTFSDEKDGVVAHKATLYMAGQSENSENVQELFLQQLKSGGGFAQYSAVVSDNVDHMRDAVAGVQAAARAQGHVVLGLGCAGHISDLLCEDVAGIDELKGIIQDVQSLTKFVLNHDKLMELFIRARQARNPCKQIQSAGLRTYPDTRFAYAALMVRAWVESEDVLADVTSRQCRDDYNEAVRLLDDSLLLQYSTRESWHRCFFTYKLLSAFARVTHCLERTQTRLSHIPMLFKALNDEPWHL